MCGNVWHSLTCFSAILLHVSANACARYRPLAANARRQAVGPATTTLEESLNAQNTAAEVPNVSELLHYVQLQWNGCLLMRHFHRRQIILRVTVPSILIGIDRY